MKKQVEALSALVVLMITLNAIPAVAQQPLDYMALENFEMISAGAKISNNGAYAAYQTELPNYNPVHGEFYKPPKGQLFFQATGGSWKYTIPYGQEFSFTQNSRFGLFKMDADSLGILKLGFKNPEYYSNVESWKVPNAGKTAVVAVRDRSGKLQVRNLASGKLWSFEKVAQYIFAPTKDILVVHDEQGLHWLDLNSSSPRLIYSGAISGGFHFNRKEDQLVFLAGTPGSREVFLYRKTKGEANKIAEEKSLQAGEGLLFQELLGFLSNNGGLLLSYSDTKLPKIKSKSNSRLKIKNYVGSVKNEQPVFVAINISSGKLTVLNSPKEMLEKALDADAWLVKDANKRLTAVQWSNGNRRTYDVFSKISDHDFQYEFSPNGNFIVYLDTTSRNYHALDLNTGKDKMISQSAHADWFGIGLHYNQDTPQWNKRWAGLIGWMDDGETIIVQERVGLWKLDLFGKKAPVPLIQCESLFPNTIFRINSFPEKLTNNSKLLLHMQDTLTKGSGLGYLYLNNAKLETMVKTGTAYNYGGTANGTASRIQSPSMIKARDTDTYLFSRQTSTELPNYFVTSDGFETEKQLSFTAADTSYNWPAKAEIHHFKRLDGGKGIGMLFKPKNFDPGKKYPLIMFYYQRFSDGVNGFQLPDMPSEGINIPWMVSHGYLVFVPDVFYRIGYTAQSVYDNIEGAARYVETFPFVNAAKLGMSGHSHGGYETNIMLTMSKRFAAAYSSAGPTNLTAPYNEYFAEHHQLRMGKTLWDIPEQYILSSPIFQADKVFTPVLFLANKEDRELSEQQQIFFTMLTRLGKRCWLMDYASGYHGMGWDNCRNYEDRKDHTTRVMQFFDHYLKDAPAPLWMLENTQDTILDKTGRTPQPKQFNALEQKKIDVYSKIPLVDKLKRITN